MKQRDIQLADFTMPDTRVMENKILGGIIGDSTLFDSVIRMIKPEMFSRDEARYTWNVLLDMHYNHETIDIVTVMPKCDQKFFMDNILNNIGEYYGMRGLSDIGMAFVDTYIKQQAYIAAVNVLQSINNGSATGDKIIGTFDNFSDKVLEGLGDESCQSADTIVNNLAERLQSGEVNKIPTTIPTIDSMTYGGLGGGNLVVLAARPSVGKTTIAMQIALHASQVGKKALCFSLEMSAEELVQRILLSTGLLSPYEFHSRNMNWQNFDKAVGQVINKNLIINDKARSIDEICQKIVVESQAGRCDFVMIDYLGLIPLGNARGKTVAQQLGEITARLKNIAKECNIPILLLCQLNRSSASENRSPQLYDLRDSGSIEQDADLVIMLEKAKDDMGGFLDNTIDAWVRKNRNGRCNFDTPIRLEGNETYSNFHEKMNDYGYGE